MHSTHSTLILLSFPISLMFIVSNTLGEEEKLACSNTEILSRSSNHLKYDLSYSSFFNLLVFFLFVLFSDAELDKKISVVIFQTNASYMQIF